MAFEMQVGSIFADVDLRTQNLVKGVNDALKNIQDFVTKGGKSLETFASSFEKKNFFANLGTNLLNGLKALGPEVSKLGTFVSGVLIKPFQALSDKIFNIKTLLVGFATVEFFGRAATVEATTAAFDSLTKSIGLTSDTLLGKLKSATKGTVSDLSLMQAANEAIQFGVVKDADSFALLAEQAKRLGRSFGVDAKNAIDTVVEGLGRQQERALKSLGIIVDTNSAYTEYALKVGILDRELTDSEKKTAFVSAATQKMGQLVANLGPQQDLATSGFGKLLTALENVSDKVAVIVAGPFGRLSSSIAKLVTDASPSLEAFANKVAEFLSETFGSVIAAVDQFVSGQLSVRGLISRVTDAAIAAVKLLFKVVANTIRQQGPDILAAVKDVAFDVGNKLSGGALSHVNTEVNKGIDAFLQAFNLFQPIAVDQFFSDKLLKRIVSGEIKVRDQIKFSGEAVTKDTATVIKEGLNQIASSFTEGTDTAANPLQSFFLKVQKIIVKANADLQQPIAASRKLFADVQKAFTSVFSFTPQPGSPQAQANQSQSQAASQFQDIIKKVAELKKTTSGAIDLSDGQKQLAAVQDQISILEESFQKLPESLRPTQTLAGIKAVTDEFAKLLDLKTLQEAIKGVDDQLRQANAEFTAVSQNPLAGKLEAVDLQLVKVKKSLINASTSEVRDSLEELAGKLTEIKDVVTETEIDKFAKEVDQQIEDMQARVAALDLPKLQAELAEIDRQNTRSILEGPIAQAEEKQRLATVKAQTTQATTIKEFQKAAADSIQATNVEIEKLGKSPIDQTLIDLREERRKAIQEAGIPTEVADKVFAQKVGAAIKKADAEGTLQLSQDIAKGVGDGVTQGILQGDSAMKILANVGANIFQSAFKRAMDNVVQVLQEGLNKVFDSLGKSLGVGGGLGGIATGLIGIGGAILTNLNAKSSSALDTVANAVTSTAQVRGVVAGPTDIPIATVGDSLKIALRQTEGILLDIRDILARGGGVGGGSSGLRNSVIPLTASTA